MPDTAKRLAGPTQPGTTAATVYTAPTTPGIAILRNIHVTNTTNVSRTFRLSIGTMAAATAIAYDLIVPANGNYDWSGFIVLGPSEIVQASQDLAAALTLTISGVEVT